MKITGKHVGTDFLVEGRNHNGSALPGRSRPRRIIGGWSDPAGAAGGRLSSTLPARRPYPPSAALPLPPATRPFDRKQEASGLVGVSVPGRLMTPTALC